MRILDPVNQLMLEQTDNSQKRDDPGTPSYNTARNNIIYSETPTGHKYVVYTFGAIVMSGDDAYRLIIDGKELLSDWGDHAETTRTATISVEAGKKYNVRIEFYDNEYNAILRMKTLMIK